MLISKVCTQIKIKISVFWHWNSLNEASITTKRCFQTFYKSNVFFKRYNKKRFR